MGKKEVITCDGCDRIIDYKERKKITKIILEGDEIYDGVSDYFKEIKELDFCERCSRYMLKALENIAGKKLNKKIKNISEKLGENK